MSLKQSAKLRSEKHKEYVSGKCKSKTNKKSHQPIPRPQKTKTKNKNHLFVLVQMSRIIIMLFFLCCFLSTPREKMSCHWHRPFHLCNLAFVVYVAGYYCTTAAPKRLIIQPHSRFAAVQLLSFRRRIAPLCLKQWKIEYDTNVIAWEVIN